MKAEQRLADLALDELLDEYESEVGKAEWETTRADRDAAWWRAKAYRDEIVSRFRELTDA